MAKITGADKVIAKMRRLAGPGFEKRVTAAVYAAADMHVAEASHLITQGSISGKGHVVSAPYSPPNEDTGSLRISGHVEQSEPFEAKSVFDAPHAVPLEFSTASMAERPFARPAAKIVKPKMKALLREAVRQELRRR